MSVFNGAKCLPYSIQSILDQSYKDFEFIIVDDGSTDTTAQVLKEYSKCDNRIRVIRQDNAGLPKALIRGCEVAQGNYIARQDADDYSFPTRLQKQVEELNIDTRIVLVSS
ncbi:MAG: glycosyltransferase family 2 protein [Lentisphaeria bacterium]|nr:glycosyltransferase family 2 protein [Lentisphaeria bacterium]